jgi:hypothetical protein
MTAPPTHFLQDLGPKAEMLSKKCGNERLAMILQYVALGSMIVMTGLAASQSLKEALGSLDRDRGHGRPR